MAREGRFANVYTVLGAERTRLLLGNAGPGLNVPRLCRAPGRTSRTAAAAPPPKQRPAAFAQALI